MRRTVNDREPNWREPDGRLYLVRCWRITAADGSRDWCALLDRWDGQDWDTLHDATGASPAAAVNALAAKLEDDR